MELNLDLQIQTYNNFNLVKFILILLIMQTIKKLALNASPSYLNSH